MTALRLFAALAITMASFGSAVAQRTKPAPPRPPSTGKELANPKVVLPAKVQAQLVRQVLARKDCKGRSSELAAALGVGATELTSDERIAANVLLARCARADKAYKALLKASTFLLAVAPDRANPDDIVQAYLGLGDERHAIAALKLVAKKYPQHAARLTVSASVIACHESDFQACFDATSKLLDALGRSKAQAPDDVVLKNRTYHAFSAAALGKWAHYDASLKVVKQIAAKHGRDPGKLAALEAKVDQARRQRLFIDTDVARQLPLGTYHLMASKKQLDVGALATVRLVNHGKSARSVRVSVEVPGVTETTTTTIALPPGRQVTRQISPPLDLDFDVVKIRAARDTQLSLRVVDATTGASLLEESFMTSVLPRDHLPLRRWLGSDARKDTFATSLAWITPNAPEIDAFLRKAKQRLPDRTFAGEQRTTLPQVKALFEELKAHGVSYVMDPKLFDDAVIAQRTRLPVEVLATTNAQCLEGTLLYATLFEAIGLRPVLVYIPGHAFIAWRASKYDVANGGPPIYFLETTMTGGDATFEQAVDQATRSFLEQAKAKHFELGAATRVDVTALRKAGYLPQPY